MKNYLLFIVVLCVFQVAAQEQSPLQLSGYLETYYVYDFSQPGDHQRPGFVYSHNRHNEVNLNIGFLKAAWNQSNVRANFALMAGTYANANLAAEPGVLKNIFEANIGFKVSKKRNLWLDTGIFPSHIGFESAIGKDCWTLTRSIMADNSPYYESGVKLTFVSNNGQWQASGLLLNGWQRIQRVEGNQTPAIGHQLIFKPNNKLTFNSSSFIGSDNADALRRMRYFHNFYMQAQASARLGLILGFDIGFQQYAPGSNLYNTWYTPVAIIRYTATDKVFLAVRGEYYHDAGQVIIATGRPNGFRASGVSLNVDYQINSIVLWRIEGKMLGSPDPVLNGSTGNFSLSTAVSAAF